MSWIRTIIMLGSLTGCAANTAKPVEVGPSQSATLDLDAQALALAHKLIIADGHIDVPYRLEAGRTAAGALSEDISLATDKGDFDFPRAKAGGLNAPFMSIYVPAKFQKEPGKSKAKADALIDLVEGLVKNAPKKFEIATHPDQIAGIVAAGKVALPMGIENGSALEDDLSNVRHFHTRGVRYVTLTHAKDNLICDSSYDETHTHKGLSEYGRGVVKEMNRVGIMIDVSHVTDDVIRQVLALSEVPVIASHSSMRHFTPGFERNLPDDLLSGIAAAGGVVLINFGSTFISQPSIEHFKTRREAFKTFAAANKVDKDSDAAKAFAKTYDAEHPKVLATVNDVVDHIEHVIKAVGIAHVGFGSDFDGVGPTLPIGLEDVSKYPNLIRTLLERGYDAAQIEKMASGNLFRVWRQVDAHAQKSGQ